MTRVQLCSILAVTCGFAAMTACGGSAGTNPPPGNDAGGGHKDAGAPDAPVTHDAKGGNDAREAAVDSGPDHGMPSSTYPAFTPGGMPKLVNNGGHVMKNPIIVPITWNSDPSQASFDTFADTLGQTNYWKATNSEYGVGPAVSGTANHVHLSTTVPTTLQDSDLQNMVATNAGAPGGWPAATEDTIYAFFLAPGTSLQIGGFGGSGDACMQGVGGYHDMTMVGSQVTAYAVVPSCNFGGLNTPAQQSTMSMSHELNEAATDPQPPSGYTGFDNGHFAFTYFQMLQVENGDACELYMNSFYEDKETTPTPFDYWVQATWSNASAAAGHDPCVPAAAGPYFNVTPLNPTMVDVTIPAEVNAFTGMSWPNPLPTQGYKVGSTMTVTFPVGLYSDASTGGPWNLSVSAGNPIFPPGASLIDKYNPSSVTATIDRTQGQNGEKAYVTVTVKSEGSLFKGEIVTITSTLNGVSHYMPVWIGG